MSGLWTVGVTALALAFASGCRQDRVMPPVAIHVDWVREVGANALGSLAAAPGSIYVCAKELTAFDGSGLERWRRGEDCEAVIPTRDGGAMMVDLPSDGRLHLRRFARDGNERWNLDAQSFTHDRFAGTALAIELGATDLSGHLALVLLYSDGSVRSMLLVLNDDGTVSGRAALPAEHPRSVVFQGDRILVDKDDLNQRALEAYSLDGRALGRVEPRLQWLDGTRDVAILLRTVHSDEAGHAWFVGGNTMGWFALGSGVSADGVAFRPDVRAHDFAILDGGVAVVGWDDPEVALLSFAGELRTAMSLGPGTVEGIVRTSPNGAAVLVRANDGDQRKWRVVSLSVRSPENQP